MFVYFIGNAVYNGDYSSGFGVYVRFSNSGTNCEFHAYNNLVIGGTLDYDANAADWFGTFYGSHNGSGDTTASDVSPSGSEQESLTASTEWLSVTGGSEDLHLATSGTTSKGAGSDRGTTPPGVELDMDGYDRDAGAVTWDIGPDQEGLPAAPSATSTIPQTMHHRKQLQAA